jgi:carboxyl-terminal processing protease
MPLTDAVRLMRGEAGTDLRLVVFRPEASSRLTFIVKREAIRLFSVRSKWIAPELAYIRTSQFRDDTRGELIAAVQKLQANGTRPLKGLVLDLRLCPGGLLTATVDIASLFISPGQSVLRTAGPQAGASQHYAASATAAGERNVPLTTEPTNWPLRDIPVVVLVDRYTGGGAEALAALLKEVRGVTVVGETTSGFGLIQQLFRLKSGASVRIGTALMSTPEGRVWHGNGIAPDVEVKRVEGVKWEFGDLQLDDGLKAAMHALRR